MSKTQKYFIQKKYIWPINVFLLINWCWSMSWKTLMMHVRLQHHIKLQNWLQKLRSFIIPSRECNCLASFMKISYNILNLVDLNTCIPYGQQLLPRYIHKVNICMFASGTDIRGVLHQTRIQNSKCFKIFKCPLQENE